jgi:hypothetical protein
VSSGWNFFLKKGGGNKPEEMEINQIISTDQNNKRKE